MGFETVSQEEEPGEEIEVAGADQAAGALKFVALLFLLGAIARAAGR